MQVKMYYNVYKEINYNYKFSMNHISKLLKSFECSLQPDAAQTIKFYYAVNTLKLRL